MGFERDSLPADVEEVEGGLRRASGGGGAHAKEDGRGHAEEEDGWAARARRKTAGATRARRKTRGRALPYRATPYERYSTHTAYVFTEDSTVLTHMT
jgi:hypothetical protein